MSTTQRMASGNKKLSKQPFKNNERATQPSNTQNTPQNAPTAQHLQTTSAQPTSTQTGDNKKPTPWQDKKNQLDKPKQNRDSIPSPDYGLQALPFQIPKEVHDLHPSVIPLQLIRDLNILYVHDKILNIHFLVDTGAERSIIPVVNKEGLSNQAVYFIAANGSHIQTFGDQEMTITLGVNREFRWKFIIADVLEPIIGADFLKAHNLLVDIANRRLVDVNEQSHIYTINHPEPYNTFLHQTNTKGINHQPSDQHNTYHF